MREADCGATLVQWICNLCNSGERRAPSRGNVQAGHGGVFIKSAWPERNRLTGARSWPELPGFRLFGVRRQRGSVQPRSLQSARKKACNQRKTEATARLANSNYERWASTADSPFHHSSVNTASSVIRRECSCTLDGGNLVGSRHSSRATFGITPSRIFPARI